MQPTKSNFIDKLNNASYFGLIISFLATPRDFKVFPCVSKYFNQMYSCETVQAQVRSFVDPRATNLSLKMCSRFSKLATLDINGFQITAEGFCHLQQLPLIRIKAKNLTALKEFIPFLPSTLQSLVISTPLLFNSSGLDRHRLPPSLTHLELSDIYNIREENFTSLSRLKHLFLSNTNVSGQAISRLTTLESLGLEDCDKVTDQAVAHFPTTLTYLDLSGSKLIENVTVSQLSSLTHLDLSECSNINEVTFPSSLTFLNLSECPRITNRALTSLSSNLRELCLKACDITDKGLLSLPKNIEYLSVSRCSLITDRGLTHLSRSLIFLNISGCIKIMGQSFGSLPCSLLTLICDRCIGITDDDLSRLPLFLEKLSLAECNLITNKGLEYLQNISLQHLCLNKCNKITDAGLLSLQNMHLHSLYLIGCTGITIVENRDSGPLINVQNWFQARSNNGTTKADEERPTKRNRKN